MDSNGLPETKEQTKRRKTNPPDNPSNPPVIAIQNKNPLLNPFILETVLIFCKGHPHQDNQSFSSLRLVCKLWDTEVCKIIRPQTQIPLPRLLSPYPDGLGWKWNPSDESIGYHYQSPYPDTPEFQNIKITVTCKMIEDPHVISWFKVMGGQVKSLHYSSALNCYHQNAFLGNCLQTWCPNLESLHLSEIQCFASLIYIFEGENQKDRKFETKGLNCAKLTSLIISVDSDDPVGYHTKCDPKNNDFLTIGHVQRPDISIVTRGTKIFRKLIEKLPERDPESGDPFYQLIENKTESLPNNYFKDVIIPKYFGPLNNFQDSSVDWGILGLILRVAPLKKIVIKKLTGQQQCRDLTLFLLYQPSQLRITLEHLEFHDNCFVGRDPVCLKTLSIFKCPFTHIRLENLFPSGKCMDNFTDFLESCADTLKILEISGAECKVRRRFIFNIPMLPNLKKFVHRNFKLLPVVGTCLLRNCPKLEICKFLDEANLSCYQRDNCTRALDMFFGNLEEIGNLEHPLKELDIFGCLNFENVVQLGKGLGNLVKVDLEVGGADELECLLEWMDIRWGRMEEFRVMVNGLGDEEGERWNEMFGKHLGKIKGLKLLEIDFQMEDVYLGVEAFKNGFGKMEGLTCLKISNFGMLENDKEEIYRSVEHVPFVSLT